MRLRNTGRFVLAMAIASMPLQQALATCTMQTQMQNANTAEQTRRLNNINTNMQTLSLLNQLETECLQGFQSIPTQLNGNSTVTMVAMNTIGQSLCQSLANTARSTTQAAMSAAQAAVQQQINAIASGVVSSTSSSGMMSNPVRAATTTTSTGIMSTISNSLSRLFQ
jgi:hypothetical protein